jgi:hypothetical protein
MKHIIIAIALLLLCSATSQAQSDTITIRKTGFGTVYKRDGKTLSLNKLERIMVQDAEAERQYRKGKHVNTVGFILGFAGGFMIGAELGRAVGSGTSVNPVHIGIGAGLIGISIPFTSSAQKKIKGAVKTYNANRRKTSAAYFKPDMYITFSGTSVGFRFVF